MNWEEEAIKKYNANIDAANQDIQDLNNQKAATLNEYNNFVNEQAAEHEALMNQQQGLINQYNQTQQDVLDKNLARTNEQIAQNRKETEENINAEKKDAYVDYMKQVNQYGGASEQLASQGLATTGYAESSRVAMYNTYQNRVSAANTALTKANVEYDRQMKEAQDNNDVAKAQLALDTLTKSYELALQGFEYKNTLFNNRMAFNLQLDDTYYNRANAAKNRIDNYTSQINNIYQNRDKMAEEKRQFDEQMAEKKREYDTSLAEEQRQYNESLALSKSKSSGGGGKSGNNNININYGDTTPEETKVDVSEVARKMNDAAAQTANAAGGTQKVKITNNGKLKLSNYIATNYFNNFLSSNNGKTITVRQLESALNTARKNNVIDDNDYKKIANYFGFDAAK